MSASSQRVTIWMPVGIPIEVHVLTTNSPGVTSVWTRAFKGEHAESAAFECAEHYGQIVSDVYLLDSSGANSAGPQSQIIPAEFDIHALVGDSELFPPERWGAHAHVRRIISVRHH